MNCPAGVLDAICALPADWQASGSLGAQVLRALDRLLPDPLPCSAETGAGKSTLLFAQRSDRHLVFARDWSRPSVAQVRQDALFRPERVEFIEGSTQQTLPRYTFTQPLHAVLIDGPHAYPFPELEYYYLYPQLAPGALLVIDDLQIPTVRRLYDFVREDDMFRELEVVATTAFLQRTSAPVFDPLGDGWLRQAYNRNRVEGR